MTVFSSMLGVLGMSLDDAALLLGCSKAQVASMSSGRSAVTRQDLKRLRTIYAKISAGETTGFHAGAEKASQALWALRGTDDLPGVVNARPTRRGMKYRRKDADTA
ncbi:MAG: hypothetical protein KAG89_02455 [Fulvimarina manganoxydans]|uniref:hypothetical protein n=1 Tax=Fulvimarina manganoxydans TaxID=937218 RepID=UPI002357908C|nr:hypothetical protein [Fulvimarina manganoxydans]MCK5931006.1 hypothetical protein [Fulvimarina manganoxydans]